jgi:hypothetical protein
MPITYVIDQERNVIFETWSGEISAADLANYWRGYLADPEVMAIRRTVVDLRNSTPTFTGAELASLVRTIALPMIAGRDWVTALVVARPLQIGISRQYHVFAESYSEDAVFHDPDTALNWVLAHERSKSDTE